MGKAYKEFSDEDRTASARLTGRLVDLGFLEWPKAEQCEACLTPKGIIELHREDYSILSLRSLVPLCYRCHRTMHMADRYPDGWQFYKNEVALGRQWFFTKSIGDIAKPLQSEDLRGSRVKNPQRDRTIFDDLDAGAYLFDTPEIRAERMRAVHDLWEAVKGKRQAVLLEEFEQQLRAVGSS